MAETDIFNPTDWVGAGLVFNPNPSYGFTRKMGSNRQVQRPRLGRYPSRQTMNGGHIFALNWYNTDITTAERIIAFYHQFQSGYFTIIDQDWHQRQYVGRFMNEPENAHPANGKYSFQGVVFEEMPQARMLVYPSDPSYAHPLNVVDDDFNPLVALMQGAWAIRDLTVAYPASTSSAVGPYRKIAWNVIPAIGDWAQIGYVGFGFQMSFQLANTLGAISIYLDEEEVVASLDLSSGVVAPSSFPSIMAGPPVVTISGGNVSISCTEVSLDQHRVKIVYAGPGGASGVSVLFPPIEYFY